jgi:hypothetical protein
VDTFEDGERALVALLIISFPIENTPLAVIGSMR